MVLSGDENDLSAPISFDAIRSQLLPLGKAGTPNDLDMVRVALRTAVRVIADLQRKEKGDFSGFGTECNGSIRWLKGR